MARLANQRHELFCQGIAQGKSATQAYIDAGYSKKGADVSASRLLGNASVMLRVEELREKVEKKNELTLDWLIQQGKEMYRNREKLGIELLLLHSMTSSARFVEHTVPKDMSMTFQYQV